VDRTIAAVGADLEAMRFNTAIASLMELVRWAHREKAAMSRPEWSRVSSSLVLLLAPFAPYLAEELWSMLGGEYSVHQQSWPAHDPGALIFDRVTMAIQIDGKTRDRIEVPAGTASDDVLEQVLERARVRRHLGQGRPTRVVFVQDRLINLVTGLEPQ
jgi:leucyl-tRNA synthetase